MNGFTKLFASIVTSTIWREDDKTRIVWITILAMKDRNGRVATSVPGLADMARVSIDECVAALAKLAAPDAWSRTKTFGGRRIEEIDGGFVVLNHDKYRAVQDEEERRNQVREAVARHRVKKAEALITDDYSKQGNVGKPAKAHSESESESEAEKKTPELAADEVGSAGWIRDNFDRLYSAQSNTVARRRRAHDEMGPVRTWSEENVAPLDAKTRASFETEFTRAAKAFFADSDPFVVKLRANLPYFLKNFDKYAMAGAPKKSNAERPPGYFFDPSTLR